MQYVLSRDGPQFGFESGSLSEYRIPVHRKPSMRIVERLVADDRLVLRSLDLSGAAASDAADAIQEFGSGKRTLVFSRPKHDFAESTDDNAELTSALAMTFELQSPLSWECSVSGHAAAEEKEPHRVRFRTHDHTTLSIEASGTVTVREESADASLVAVAMPAGTSALTITIGSTPFFRVCNSVVICRPGQLREAAIVLSCLASDAYRPLIVAERSPIAAEEYSRIYDEFRAAHDSSMTNVFGLAPSSQSPQQIRETLRLIQRHRQLQDELAPYRSWVKRNSELSRLLSDLNVTDVYLLFGASDADFVRMVPEVRDEDDPPFFPSKCRIVALLHEDEPEVALNGFEVVVQRYSSLGDLLGLAWSMFRPGPLPSRAIEVHADEVSEWPMGLYDAISEGVPLRPAASVQRAGFSVRSPATGDGSHETVLVELTGQAADLVGVLYALARGAWLITRPIAQLDEVQKALDRFNHDQVESAGFVHLLAAALRFVLARSQRAGLRRIEAAVNAQVPPGIVEAVADRSLTAFTRGLPYSFVKRDGVDWTEKPIGHVVNDSDLVVLRELFTDGRPRNVFGLSAIFDPGYFRDSETADVSRALEEQLLYPLVLDQRGASLYALDHLGKLTVVGFLFFNTHGSDNAIMLDVPLLNSLLVQWMSLAGRPIVFNNSCLSWTGVGREFIRVGARGYVGTLWSVKSDEAASMARHVVSRLTRGLPLAAALRDSTVPHATRKAYIVVGTTNTALDNDVELSAESSHAYVSEGVLVLTQLLMTSAVDGRVNSDASRRAFVKILHHHFMLLVERLEAMGELPAALLLFARMTELRLLARNPVFVESTPEYEAFVVERCRAHLTAADLGDEQREAFDADIRHAQVEINQRRGEAYDALELIQRDLQESGEPAEENLNELPMLIELLKQTGQIREAIDVGKRALERFTADDHKNGIVTVMGQLAQLYLRTGDHEAALDLARRGGELAVSIGEKHRQPTFKIDEANILRAMQKFDEAIAAAKDASRLSRINMNEQGDLRSHGVIGQCYLAKGDLALARQWMTNGYDHAEQAGDLLEQARFAGDLADLDTLEGKIDEAAARYVWVLEALLRLEHVEAVPATIARMTAIALRQPDVTAHGKVLCIQLMVVNELHPQGAGLVVPAIVQILKAHVKPGVEGSQQPILRSIAIALRFGESCIADPEFHAKDHFLFLLDVLQVFAASMLGNKDALPTARDLDRISGGALELEKLFTTAEDVSAGGQ